MKHERMWLLRVWLTDRNFYVELQKPRLDAVSTSFIHVYVQLCITRRRPSILQLRNTSFVMWQAQPLLPHSL